MRFVDDENLVPVACWPEPYVFSQLAHFVDAAVRRRVDLDHVQSGSCSNLFATRAHAARGRGRSFLAVQAPRQNARHSSLSRPALARKDVAVRNASLRNRVFQSDLHVLLADQLRKALRPVFASDHLVHEWKLVWMASGKLCQTPGDPRHTG